VQPRFWWSGRVVVYVIGFFGAALLDAKTPLGVADWLFEVLLVWVAVTWGASEEMIVIAIAGTATMLAGIWTSPDTLVPLWIGALNRIVALGVIWTMVHVARARLIAEAARARAAAEIKILRGLLPICASCKRIRCETNQWHSVEAYISEHSEALFTHTYCPECLRIYFPEMSDSAGESG
jgi:hypothetical protein